MDLPKPGESLFGKPSKNKRLGLTTGMKGERKLDASRWVEDIAQNPWSWKGLDPERVWHFFWLGRAEWNYAFYTDRPARRSFGGKKCVFVFLGNCSSTGRREVNPITKPFFTDVVDVINHPQMVGLLLDSSIGRPWKMSYAPSSEAGLRLQAQGSPVQWGCSHQHICGTLAVQSWSDSKVSLNV